VFFFPGNLVCVLAGASRMSPVLFAVCNVAGTLTILGVLYTFGDVFNGPVSSVTDFISRNFAVFTTISVLLTVYWLWDQRRRGKGDPTSIAEVERELGTDEHPPSPPPPPPPPASPPPPAP